MKKLIVIIILVVLLIAGALTYIILSDRLVVALKNPGSQYSTGALVCSNDIVSRYNEVTEYAYRDGPDELPRTDPEGLKSLASEIRGKSGFEADATCQTILFWAAIDAADAGQARTALEAIETLNERSLYPSNNLRTAVPLFEYKNAIDALSIEPQDGIVTTEDMQADAANQ